jgi:hypothetical protein
MSKSKLDRLSQLYNPPPEEAPSGEFLKLNQSAETQTQAPNFAELYKEGLPEFTDWLSEFLEDVERYRTRQESLVRNSFNISQHETNEIRRILVHLASIGYRRIGVSDFVRYAVRKQLEQLRRLLPEKD